MPAPFFPSANTDSAGSDDQVDLMWKPFVVQANSGALKAAAMGLTLAPPGQFGARRKTVGWVLCVSCGHAQQRRARYMNSIPVYRLMDAKHDVQTDRLIDR
eukprot:scaffold262161_cov30-Prasinocladus_malaysianus.AAC.1